MPGSTCDPVISESHPKDDRLHPSIQMSANPINSERVFAEAALEHWRQLGEELRADVDEFNRREGYVSLSEPAPNEYRVTHSSSGLEVRIVADTQNHIIRYDFNADGRQECRCT